MPVFQLTVTLVVYSALAEIQPDQWVAAHARHSQRITPLVALVYGAALACCVGALINSFCAGPTHRRLDSGLDPVLIRRLLTCDRWRTAASVLALGGAVLLAIG